MTCRRRVLQVQFTPVPKRARKSSQVLTRRRNVKIKGNYSNVLYGQDTPHSWWTEDINKGGLINIAPCIHVHVRVVMYINQHTIHEGVECHTSQVTFQSGIIRIGAGHKSKRKSRGWGSHGLQ